MYIEGKQMIKNARMNENVYINSWTNEKNISRVFIPEIKLK